MKVRNNRLRRAVGPLMRELDRMALAQADKIFRRLAHAPARIVEAEVASLVRKRHARRKARLQQKASRRRNAR